MAFYGRFTRKQRAASIWFKSGKVPLNSVNCRMDYAFYTVPLKNSAVSVKVWLYKTPLVYDWVYKVPEYEAIS
jgi:ribosomal protein S3